MRSERTAYEYDVRDLVSKVTNGKSATDPDPKVTTYTYTDRGERLRQVKGNGNTVDRTYYLDGLLNTQVERKPNGTLVSEHTIDYNLNGHRSRDVAKKMNADDHTAYLTTTSEYTYDPRDRIAKVTKTGDGAGTESYVHDANNNVIEQAIAGVTTTYRYDRNRLLTSTAAGATSSYNYDPYGRLDTVTSGGEVVERNIYDGFDHTIEHHKTTGGTTAISKYTYDPLDRTITKTTNAGTSTAKTTRFNYIGLSKEVLDEEVAGKITKSYQHAPTGERLSQTTHNDDGTEDDAYYGYNLHTDVEQVTDENGDTEATYGYTAYGNNDEAQFTGIDKPDTTDPTKDAYNVYRYNAKRWDPASKTYDMGFRDYNPGLNRFTTRDTYNGALADMHLGTDPWTGNRYAFAGGNPITGIELDGHKVIECGGSHCIGDGGNGDSAANTSGEGYRTANGRAEQRAIDAFAESIKFKDDDGRTVSLATASQIVLGAPFSSLPSYEQLDFLVDVACGHGTDQQCEEVQAQRDAASGALPWWFPLAVAAGFVAVQAGLDPAAMHDCATKRDLASCTAAVPLVGRLHHLTGTGRIVSKYEDVTRPGARVVNKRTDVGPVEFGKNLEANGWTRINKGPHIEYRKNGARYFLRAVASTHDGWTADFYPPGSRRMTLKIRLGEG